MTGTNQKDRSLAILIVYCVLLVALIAVYRNVFMTIAAIVVMSVFIIQYIVPRVLEKKAGQSDQSE